MAAFEGKWLVVSGCVQVGAGKPPIIDASIPLPKQHAPDFFKEQRNGQVVAGKPLIIAASLGWNERSEPDFLHQDGTAKPVKKRQVKWHWHACRLPLQ